ncbi:integrase family protein [Bacillus methanolicus PB1]|uniref:Integrase family protein n=1 Tax=Bacillus methanolicus PB1 TaxID=997296 RepID=I3E5P2_BACMT|nr:tyrosine-type recombinase/integrase [Bacillus methanolicus]EIJ81813.1 integrase family protein [Bacillus methanolicus PB1]
MVVRKHTDRKIKETDLWYYEFQYQGIRRKKSGFKSRPEAERAEAAEKEKIRRQLSGEYEIEENMQDYIQEWLDGRRNIGDNTRSTYQIHLTNHIKPFFKNKTVNQVNPIDVKRFLDSLHEKELSTATVKKSYNILNRFFNDLVKMKMLRENPCDGIEKPKEQNKKVEVFDEKELKEFLKFSEGYTRYSFAFKLAAHTGLRRGELLALQWRDIDLDNKTIYVRKRLVRAAIGTDRYMQDGTKTSIGRFVSFSEQMKKEFIKYKQLQDYEKESNEYEDNDLVIATQNGKFVSVDNLSRIFRNTLKASPVNKQLSFHALRHTHATLMLKAGVQMKVVSERLGHSSIKITMDTYSHLLPSMEQDAVERFERLFE